MGTGTREVNWYMSLLLPSAQALQPVGNAWISISLDPKKLIKWKPFAESLNHYELVHVRACLTSSRGNDAGIRYPVLTVDDAGCRVLCNLRSSVSPRLAQQQAIIRLEKRIQDSAASVSIEKIGLHESGIGVAGVKFGCYEFKMLASISAAREKGLPVTVSDTELGSGPVDPGGPEFLPHKFAMESGKLLDPADPQHTARWNALSDMTVAWFWILQKERVTMESLAAEVERFVETEIEKD